MREKNRDDAYTEKIEIPEGCELLLTSVKSDKLSTNCHFCSRNGFIADTVGPAAEICA